MTQRPGGSDTADAVIDGGDERGPATGESTAATAHAPEEDRLKASGRGHWPGTDVLAAVHGIVADAGPEAFPFLPVMPARGPGGELAGYAAALLVELHADLRPHGWQVAQASAGGPGGRDSRRALSLHGQDRDALAEAFHAPGRSPRGPLMISLPGPVTLAAVLYGPGEERMIADAGARRDLLDSYAEGAAAHVRTLRALLPDVSPIVRLEEPELVRALSGRIRSASGFKAIGPFPEHVAGQRLRQLREALLTAGAAEVTVQLPGRAPLHWDLGEGPRPLLPLLRQAGVTEIGVDLGALGVREWEILAEAFESGLRPWLNLPAAPSVKDALERVLSPWRRLGMPVKDVPELGLQLGRAPAVTPADALALTRPAASVSGRPAPSDPRADLNAALSLADALREEARR